MISSPYATSLTREGKLDMSNRKPYRTKAQRAIAKKTAKKDSRGIWHSTAEVSYHKAERS